MTEAIAMKLYVNGSCQLMTFSPNYNRTSQGFSIIQDGGEYTSGKVLANIPVSSRARQTPASIWGPYPVGPFRGRNAIGPAGQLKTIDYPFRELIGIATWALGKPTNYNRRSTLHLLSEAGGVKHYYGEDVSPGHFLADVDMNGKKATVEWRNWDGTLWHSFDFNFSDCFSGGGNALVYGVITVPANPLLDIFCRTVYQFGVWLLEF